ncbi:MAG TPA: hypothetical protein VN906_09170 [Candidatus Sulfotelmatobacter sp.]|jgi:membrane protein implicated in regulation of membrane protease activity|nr:hypothetical protein [Candidatus Sulfotelmatobacter sp.]
MPNFLIGSAYAVSVGLIIFAVSANLAPADWKFPLVMAWAIAGLVLAFLAVILARRGSKSGQDAS